VYLADWIEDVGRLGVLTSFIFYLLKLWVL